MNSPTRRGTPPHHKNNFTGQVISSYLAHYNPQAILNNNTRIKTNLNYDHANRLLEVYKTINDADSTKRLVSRNVYDQMGQVKQKQLGQLPADGSFLETQDYSYNIRGWLKGINKDYANNDNSHGGNSRWFGMELSYDWGFGTNQLNGNIGGNKWRSKGDGQQRAYGFGYDGANRLLYGDFNQYGSSWDRTAGVDFSMMMGNGTDPATAYDENGNIKFMLQSGWQLGGSHPIDSLAYTYYTHSNKLQNVIDGRNDTATKLGDFRTSALSPYATGKTSAAIDYSYDVNGNLTRDLNKDIGSQTADGIIYNHLNLPWQVKIRSATGTKGTITYIYDATGNKLEKLTMDSAGKTETTTAYIGPFQYQGKNALGSGNPADTLLFFGQEEGRVRVVSDTTGGQAKTGFKYDYFIKDHLGNTRLVLTEEQQTDLYPAATMEVADSALEDLYYSNLAGTRVDISTIMGYPADTTTKPNDKVAQLSGSTGGQKVGPGIVLKVMAGDQFNIQASSWYQLMGAAPGTPVNPITDLLSALISGVGGLPGGGHPSPALLSGNSAPLSSNITSFLSDTGTLINSSKPHAFVNWVLFDDQFNYVKESSGFDQVGGDQEFKKHKLLNLPVTKSGYLYIYVSNETPNVNVFFDNLQVSHVRGPLLEEDHYYPFGLTMAGISNEALKTPYAENKYRYNKGSELQNKEFTDGSGMELYETPLRSLDPQLGRWWWVDSKPTEAESPYSAMGNNPIFRNDPLGDSAPGFLARAWNAINQVHLHHSEPGEYNTEPVKAGLTDVSYELGNIVGQFGIQQSRDALITAFDPKASTSDKALAIATAVASTARGEEGPVSPESATGKPVEPYEVGMIKDLWKRSAPGDNLTVHHAPQGKPASQLLTGYDYSDAPGIMVPKPLHDQIPTLKGDQTMGSPRAQLAKDIWDLRNHTDAPNESLQKLIDLNKYTWPELYQK